MKVGRCLPLSAFPHPLANMSYAHSKVQSENIQDVRRKWVDGFKKDRAEEQGEDVKMLSKNTQSYYMVDWLVCEQPVPCLCRRPFVILIVSCKRLTALQMWQGVGDFLNDYRRKHGLSGKSSLLHSVAYLIPVPSLARKKL